MRFNGLTIPQDVIITNVFIRFKTDETNSGVASLKIEAHAVDRAPTFISANGNTFSRPLTNAIVNWEPVPWLQLVRRGLSQQTPDITSVVQEIVNRPGLSNDNSLVTIITGSGARTAESFNGDAVAPLLHIEYQ
ncbi:MAG: hypothetical protein V3V18_13830 [Methylococcales bacterium]